MTMNDADPRDPVLNGDEVRNITFGKGYYNASQVNDLLARIAAELDAGRPAGPLIANATFKKRSLLGRNDHGPVDWFLEQLRRREDPSEIARTNADPWRDLAADPYCIRGGLVAAPSKQECADAWRDFGHQPGTRLSLVTTGVTRQELRTAEQQTVAVFVSRYPLFVRLRLNTYPLFATAEAGGRTFTMKRVTRSSWPGIAETISRDRPGAPAHSPKRQTDKKDPRLRRIIDETGTPILYTAGQHFNSAAGGYIKFPGQRWLRFPVRGTSQRNAIMTAVDQAGNKVARYRVGRGETRFRTTTEITVHPDQRLTDELALAIAAPAPWLLLYFLAPSPSV
jgi:DivIVA domain-containing protein